MGAISYIGDHFMEIALGMGAIILVIVAINLMMNSVEFGPYFGVPMA
jgi:hypothetical protein